ncbi:lipase family protein [Pseudomonas entomophila]|uniref:lipase family protein n=1 Tax=Pseudomonas entomophila TaxID=312306 RepID=UPI001F006AB8|nr:lipase family protein [Pseudomonas entomophila]MCG8292878.1 lipase family protein [Pseudomonas entomophila]
MKKLLGELSSPINSNIFACPVEDCRTSFQLVDEFGQGEPYAGLNYEAVDREGITYTGVLDIEGSAVVSAHYSGGLVVRFYTIFSGVDKLYKGFVEREFYPLQITELQVRAEGTQFKKTNGSRTEDNPAQAKCDHFLQVEVRDLVQYTCHLPPATKSNFPPEEHAKKLMRGHGAHGVCLRPNQRTVLEVRPLRALRLVLSKDPGFCVLNMYQLALMATLSYSPFGQEPDGHPVQASTVSFPHEPSVGNWFAESLSAFREIWRVDTKLTQSFYPFYEEVPYSQRWEIAPFDPDLYPYNHPEQRDLQEHPAKLHFLDDRNRFNATDTQAFVVHTPDQMLIAIRGTSEFMADALRDADALQVEFSEGEGRVHRGFYESAMQAYAFVRDYMRRFHAHQQLIICGHSLGGAVALLLAEMLRRQVEGIDIQLYTFGAPRAGDTTFMQGAADLIHHRIVNDNDPVPSVPASWMHRPFERVRQDVAQDHMQAPLGVKTVLTSLGFELAESYEHHGELRHFMSIPFAPGRQSAVLWTPGCSTITEQALCNRILRHEYGLPERMAFMDQLFRIGDHFMVAYIPACWAALRRHQEVLLANTPPVTRRELSLIRALLVSFDEQIQRRQASIKQADPHRRQHENRLQIMHEERRRLEATLMRLSALATTTVTATQVYGSLANHPELETVLARWHAHDVNNREEQLAMVPAELPSSEPPIIKVSFDEILAMLDAESDPSDPLNLI